MKKLLKKGVLFIVVFLLTITMGCAFGTNKRTEKITTPQGERSETLDVKGFFVTGGGSSYYGGGYINGGYNSPKVMCVPVIENGVNGTRCFPTW